jgi:NADP-dependent 3-hydroxy acid dehydrogenase YdfG
MLTKLLALTRREHRAFDDLVTAHRLAGHDTCIALPADVSTTTGVQALTDAFAARTQKLDILVDIAGAAVRLTSQAGDYVVGTIIKVDGGVSHASLSIP